MGVADGIIPGRSKVLQRGSRGSWKNPGSTPSYNKIKNNPPSLTKQVHEDILEGVKNGYSLKNAALLAGLGRDVVNDYIANYRYNPECPETIIAFCEELEVASAKAETRAVDKIKTAIDHPDPRTWTAAAWFLERRNPEEWGRRDRNIVTHENEAPVLQVNQVILADSNAREASRDFLRGIVSGRPDITIGPGVGDELEEGSRSARSTP